LRGPSRLDAGEVASAVRSARFRIDVSGAKPSIACISIRAPVHISRCSRSDRRLPEVCAIAASASYETGLAAGQLMTATGRPGAWPPKAPCQPLLLHVGRLGVRPRMRPSISLRHGGWLASRSGSNTLRDPRHAHARPGGTPQDRRARLRQQNQTSIPITSPEYYARSSPRRTYQESALDTLAQVRDAGHPGWGCRRQIFRHGRERAEDRDRHDRDAGDPAGPSGKRAEQHAWCGRRHPSRRGEAIGPDRLRAHHRGRPHRECRRSVVLLSADART